MSQLLEKYRQEKVQLLITLGILDRVIKDLEGEMEKGVLQDFQKKSRKNHPILEFPFGKLFEGYILPDRTVEEKYKKDFISKVVESKSTKFDVKNKSREYISNFLREKTMSVLFNSGNLLVKDIALKVLELSPELSVFLDKNPKGLKSRVERLLNFLEQKGEVKRSNSNKKFVRWSHNLK